MDTYNKAHIKWPATGEVLDNNRGNLGSSGLLWRFAKGANAYYRSMIPLLRNMIAVVHSLPVPDDDDLLHELAVNITIARGVAAFNAGGRPAYQDPRQPDQADEMRSKARVAEQLATKQAKLLQNITEVQEKAKHQLAIKLQNITEEQEKAKHRLAIKLQNTAERKEKAKQKQAAKEAKLTEKKT
jgi:hypothetical protein